MSKMSAVAARRGLFVTLEGGEGAGKSTQARRLQAGLSALGHDAIVTREPGGSPRAEAIRAVLLSGAAKPFGSFAEAALFAAARLDHVRSTVAPALARGTSVICDRFVDSTRVYQGDVVGVRADHLAAFERAATGGLGPDLTLLLDLPAEVGLARARDRRREGDAEPDRFEAEGLAFHRRVREAFLRIAAAEPDRCVVVDASAEPDAVAAAAWAALALRAGLATPS